MCGWWKGTEHLVVVYSFVGVQQSIQTDKKASISSGQDRVSYNRPTNPGHIPHFLR
jgi:hypothetical protein